MPGRWMRHGTPAAVSTLLAVIVGALTKLATAGWSWALTAGLLVAAAYADHGRHEEAMRLGLSPR